MQIKQNTNRYKLINLKENEFRKIVKGLIKEELGSFPNQYDVSKLCAKKIVECINKLSEEEIHGILHRGECHTEVIKTDNKNIREIKIILTQVALYGNLVSFDIDNKSVTISIGIRVAMSKNEGELTDIIQHELMHGNSYINRTQSVGIEDFDDVPDYYAALLDIFRKYPCGSITYNFAHALYCCYYQETNALVSQVYSSIMSRIKDNIITKNQFITAYLDTDSYNEFKTVVSETVPCVEVMTDEMIKKDIVEPFNASGGNIDVNFVKKQCKRIRKIATEALKDCARNAALCYQNLRDNGQIE